MNEQKIEGLWWKARIGYNNQQVDPEVLAKFAELIVVKCANIVWDEAEKIMNKEINEVGYELLKQFGIEE